MFEKIVELQGSHIAFFCTARHNKYSLSATRRRSYEAVLSSDEAASAILAASKRFSYFFL